MIQLGSYSSDFEMEYFDAVCKVIKEDNKKKEIIKSCKKILPYDFFKGSENDLIEEFKLLILAPFKELKRAEKYIRDNTISIMKTECFDKVYEAYELVAKSIKNGFSMRVRIVKNAGLTVCPYCNRDYINCRAENVSGAQLDHFFSRSEFPLFSICLYNLVPVCGNCNRIKGGQDKEFVSPFDDKINWQKDITFYYRPITLEDAEIVVCGKGNLKNNIREMRIDEAYQIHISEVLELREKLQTYNETQRQEFQEVLSKVELTDLQIKKSIFGPEITKESMLTKPLGKMMSDLHKEMGIY
jgi:5-methylcytosine-specific restriction endonuclease McrA